MIRNFIYLEWKLWYKYIFLSLWSKLEPRFIMKILVMRGNESCFLYESSTETEISHVIDDINSIYNGQQRVERICSEMSCLAENGICLSAQQSEEIDSQHDFTPTGGFKIAVDPVGKRNGEAPNDDMRDILMKTVRECQAKVSKKCVPAEICLSLRDIEDCVSMLKGAVTIVYPNGLPSYDPISRDLEGDPKETADESVSRERYELWWAGKLLKAGEKLRDHVGRNEKTKIVVRLQEIGLGAPSRGPALSEEDQRLMASLMHKRQEELRGLEDDDDDSHLGSAWADSKMLKSACQGVKGIRFGPK